MGTLPYTEESHERTSTSTNPESRKAALQTANPYKLDVYGKIELFFTDEKRYEKMLHSLLADYRTEASNEWFEIPEEFRIGVIDPLLDPSIDARKLLAIWEKVGSVVPKDKMYFCWGEPPIYRVHPTYAKEKGLHHVPTVTEKTRSCCKPCLMLWLEHLEREKALQTWLKENKYDLETFCKYTIREYE